MATVTDLTQLLQVRTGFEAIDVARAPNQIRITGRVPPNGSSPWILLVHHLLLACEHTVWKADISRYYFLRQMENGQKRLFYTWRVILQGQQIEQHLPAIAQAVKNAPRPARVELQEFPLAGAQREHANGKGVYSAETTPMVAHIAATARMGGVR